MFSFESIYFRPIERRDLEVVRQLHNDETTLMKLTDTTMINEIQQQEWFESLCKSRSSWRFVVLNTDFRVIGLARFDFYDPRNRSVQVGGDIIKDCRGQGFGRQMIKACIKYAFDVLNCHRVYLSVLETNQVAIDLYRSVGFQEEGRLTQAIFRDGRYMDYINMYILRGTE